MQCSAAGSLDGGPTGEKTRVNGRLRAGARPRPTRPSFVRSRGPHDDPPVFAIYWNLSASWAMMKPVPHPKYVRSSIPASLRQSVRPQGRIHARKCTRTHSRTHARTHRLARTGGRWRGCSRDELDELEDAGDAEDAQDLEDADDARVAVRRAVSTRIEAVLRDGAAPIGHARRR